jgi:hypothetical protein
LHCKIGAARYMRPGCRVVHRVVSNGSGYGVITITARCDFQVGCSCSIHTNWHYMCAA